MEYYMQICTFASGSSGNCTFVRGGDTNILIDAGISARRITKSLSCLDVCPDTLSGILITHEHSDHMKGIETLVKHHRIPIYTTEQTARQLCYRIAFLDDLIRPVQPGEVFALGQCTVHAFKTPHDTSASACFAIEHEGAKMALVTDLGHVTQDVMQAVKGAQMLVLESNHDTQWVESGPYPYFLKKRILGDHGHLSNEDSANFAKFAIEHGTKTILLAHLSSENNTPAHAHMVHSRILCASGIDLEREIHISVAPRDTLSPVFEIQGQTVSCAAR